MAPLFSALRKFFLGCSSAALLSGASGVAETSPWLPDLKNGQYKNPVLFADYSDPDAMRVGDDFYLVSSSFSHVPGLPILHSRDLVNWSLIGHALPRLVPEEHFSTPRPGMGVWAPAIRFHDGKFWIYYPDPDFGIYLVTATHAEGPWSEPILIKAGKGLIDPCPFWNDDGKLYLIHGWAFSRSGISNRLTLVQLNDAGTRFQDEGRVVVDGDKIEGWRTLEGPKLYKRGEYYYIFAPAGGVKTGWQAVFRSKSLFGPYESRIVLEQGSTKINGPHQGAWIHTPGGQDWFLHFQDRDAYGRLVHLQPMEWRNDWPVMGEDPEGDGKGQPVLVHAKPDLKPAALSQPSTTDEFEDGRMALSWQWQANPKPDWASLAAVPGSLRLACIAASPNLYLAPNLLLQKFPAPEFEVMTKLQLEPKGLEERAGLVVFGYDYAWIGLKNTPTGVKLYYSVHEDAVKDTPAKETFLADLPDKASVTLRLQVRVEAICEFAYSLDGKSFSSVEGSFQARPGRWVGAKVGLFAQCPSHAPVQAESGHADFSWFRVSPLSPPR